MARKYNFNFLQILIIALFYQSSRKKEDRGLIKALYEAQNNQDKELIKALHEAQNNQDRHEEGDEGEDYWGSFKPTNWRYLNSTTQYPNDKYSTSFFC